MSPGEWARMLLRWTPTPTSDRRYWVWLDEADVEPYWTPTPLNPEP